MALAETLSDRALGRATLARQLLLDRSDLSVLEAVEHLVGMQAQVPTDPYVGLWSRIVRFVAADLSQLLIDRALVRTVVMRGTIHLLTANDCLLLRPLMQPVLDKELARHAEYAPRLAGVDLAPVLAFSESLLAERPRTGAELRTALTARFPTLDAAALAYACRNHLALVQVPPRGVWGQSAQVRSTTAEAWIGRPLEKRPSIDGVVLRYLRAFGPATAADVAAWSRLTGMREVLDRLRPELRRFRDDHDRVLFDLPDAPRPQPDMPAPVRFLPEYDNVLLSYADRSRFVGPEARTRLQAARVVKGTVLHDGRLAATWSVERDGAARSATLVVATLPGLNERARTEIATEGRHLLDFSVDGVDRRDVRVVASP
jgi:Winged helix DNA-binding domain